MSSEIESLQNRSLALNNRLENRRQVEKLLGPAVEEISIPPNVVSTISEGPVDENFLKALAELQRKLTAMDKKSEASESIKAQADVKPLLESLRNKVTFGALHGGSNSIDSIRHLNEPEITSSLKSRLCDPQT